MVGRIEQELRHVTITAEARTRLAAAATLEDGRARNVPTVRDRAGLQPLHSSLYMCH